jgi:predicted nucleic acid-binding protein
LEDLEARLIPPGGSGAHRSSRPLLTIDTSVVVKWLVPERTEESDVPAALSLLTAIERHEVEVLQPVHWLIEVGAAVARLRPAKLEDKLDELGLMEFQIADSDSILRRACRMAAALQHHAFDTLYHAVALECRGVLVTADGRYERKARDLGRVLALHEWRLAFDPS